MSRSTIRPRSNIPLVNGLRWLGAVLLIVVVAGCQRGPQLGRVTGTVTANGEPVPFAYVVFNPVKPPRTYGSAYANERGQYELKFSSTSNGAPIGKHQVSITAAKGDELSDDAKPSARLKVPSKYNTATELQAEVKPGSNVIDFALVIDATENTR
jgi:hypothetical protein